MNTSEAANKPSDLEPKYRGETRRADGYQYWTTSPEDEEALDIREQVAAQPAEPAPAAPKRRKVLAPGAFRRTALRFVSLILITLLLAMAYFIFNYVQVSRASGQDSTQPVDAIIVLGAAQYNGTPSYVLQERLDHAYNLYSEEVASHIFVTGAGAAGDLTTEGNVGYIHLLNKGVPDADLSLIPEGTNSWQQISASAAAIEEMGFETVLLVSDKYHSYRLLAIADELGLEASVSPSAVEPSMMDYLRESTAVSIGRITGYRRLSSFTED